MEMMYSLLWFVIGAVSYRIISRLLQYGAMLNLYTQTLLCSLAILKMTEDNILTAQAKRRETEIKSGMSEEEVRKNDVIEDRAIEIWRQLSITSIINLTPTALRPAIKFKNWRQAINFLDSKINSN